MSTTALSTPTPAERSCDHCGTGFEPDRRTQRFCSTRCRRRDRDQRAWKRTKVDPEFAAEYRAGNLKRVAAYQSRSAPARKREARRQAAERTLAKAVAGIGTARVWYMGWCECGAPFVSQQDTTVVCSDLCRRRRSRKHSRAKHGRMDNHRKRARILGVEYEPIHRLKVFERDGWRCGVCGKRVDPSLPATHERGATLDHIIPMNAIDLGPHIYGNVQCAHRECNWRRGRTGAAQMLLVA